MTDRGVRVQITDSQTGALIARVPAIICSACGDVVLCGLGMDKHGRCACCAQQAKERH